MSQGHHQDDTIKAEANYVFCAFYARVQYARMHVCILYARAGVGVLSSWWGRKEKHSPDCAFL